MRIKGIAVLLLVVAIGLSIWAYPQLPDQVVTHWGPKGEPDDYSSKLFAVIFGPGMMVLMYFLIRVLPKIDPKKKNYPRFQGSLDIVMLATLTLLLVVHAVMIFVGLGYDIPMMMIVPLMVGALFVVLGNVMPRFKHNYFVGIRTPWTLANEKVWTRTHMAVGKVFFFGGFLLMASALVPSSFMLPVFLVIVIAIPLLSLVMSYYYYKNQQD